MKKLGELTLYGEYTLSTPGPDFANAVEFASINHPTKQSAHVYADCEVYLPTRDHKFPDWPTLRAWVEAQMALGILGDE